MPDAETTLATTIAELRCVDPTSPARLSHLRALATARQGITALIDSAVDELRSRDRPTSWDDIAAALDLSSSDAARKRHRAFAGDILVSGFWTAHRGRLSWSFVPAAFLYALYMVWNERETPTVVPMSAETFTRRLKPLVTQDGAWTHTRRRADAALRAPEPLLDSVSWRPAFDGRAVWGFQRRA